MKTVNNNKGVSFITGLLILIPIIILAIGIGATAYTEKINTEEEIKHSENLDETVNDYYDKLRKVQNTEIPQTTKINSKVDYIDLPFLTEEALNHNIIVNNRGYKDIKFNYKVENNTVVYNSYYEKENQVHIINKNNPNNKNVILYGFNDDPLNKELLCETSTNALTKCISFLNDRYNLNISKGDKLQFEVQNKVTVDNINYNKNDIIKHNNREHLAFFKGEYIYDGDYNIIDTSDPDQNQSEDVFQYFVHRKTPLNTTEMISFSFENDSYKTFEDGELYKYDNVPNTTYKSENCDDYDYLSCNENDRSNPEGDTTRNINIVDEVNLNYETQTLDFIKQYNYLEEKEYKYSYVHSMLDKFNKTVVRQPYLIEGEDINIQILNSNIETQETAPQFELEITSETDKDKIYVEEAKYSIETNKPVKRFKSLETENTVKNVYRDNEYINIDIKKGNYNLNIYNQNIDYEQETEEITGKEFYVIFEEQEIPLSNIKIEFIKDGEVVKTERANDDGEIKEPDVDFDEARALCDENCDSTAEVNETDNDNDETNNDTTEYELDVNDKYTPKTFNETQEFVYEQPIIDEERRSLVYPDSPIGVDDPNCIINSIPEFENINNMNTEECEFTVVDNFDGELILPIDVLRNDKVAFTNDINFEVIQDDLTLNVVDETTQEKNNVINISIKDKSTLSFFEGDVSSESYILEYKFDKKEFNETYYSDIYIQGEDCSSGICITDDYTDELTSNLTENHEIEEDEEEEDDTDELTSNLKEKDNKLNLLTSGDEVLIEVRSDRFEEDIGIDVIDGADIGKAIDLAEETLNHYGEELQEGDRVVLINLVTDELERDHVVGGGGDEEEKLTIEVPNRELESLVSDYEYNYNIYNSTGKIYHENETNSNNKLHELQDTSKEIGDYFLINDSKYVTDEEYELIYDDSSSGFDYILDINNGEKEVIIGENEKIEFIVEGGAKEMDFIDSTDEMLWAEIPMLDEASPGDTYKITVEQIKINQEN